MYLLIDLVLPKEYREDTLIHEDAEQGVAVDFVDPLSLLQLFLDLDQLLQIYFCESSIDCRCFVSLDSYLLFIHCLGTY